MQCGSVGSSVLLGARLCGAKPLVRVGVLKGQVVSEAAGRCVATLEVGYIYLLPTEEGRLDPYPRTLSVSAHSFYH